MSKLLPKAVTDLVEALKLLPGVGERSAERYAYALLRGSQQNSKVLADALTGLHEGVGYCQKTFALVPKDQELSDLYTDPKRDKTVVAVVAEPFDVVALEHTGGFEGTYHVLGGLLSPIDGVGADDLRVGELIERVDEDKVTEIILATNASVEGESTALLIKQALGDRKVKLTRLAQGLPIGVDIEYADQITLSRAIQNRREVGEDS